MTREQIVNSLKANTTNQTSGHFSVMLYKKNFYSKRVFLDFITATDSYQEAKSITNELNKKFANEFKEHKCSVIFATSELFATAYSYKFAKQS